MKDEFDMPDMDQLARQMEDAMSEAQKALDDLPAQMEGMESLMGLLSALVGNMPAQTADLNTAVSGFEAQHEANIESLAGEPDWSLEADIRVGQKLHILVNAAFDLQKIKSAWHSTQGAGFEALVAGTVAAVGVEAALMNQVMSQLQQGRSIAVVENIEVLTCHIAGAPGDAAAQLQLSPEGNIPLAVNESGLSFEFAPLLTVRNRWERADIPTFTPMAQEIVVCLDRFESREAFHLEFEPAGQAEEMAITLSFQPLV
jgi:hypothetical protein